jgi:hypothetical protein
MKYYWLDKDLKFTGRITEPPEMDPEELEKFLKEEFRTRMPKGGWAEPF